MTVARGQTFRAEPLSKRTDGTQWPEQPTEIYNGRVWSGPSSVIIREYYASGSANRHHVNQSLQGGGSLNSGLAQGSNQCVSVSIRRCQQALNRNTSLSTL